MNHPILRWGILGTANIARKNWLAIRNSGNGTVTAVASRTTARAEQFIRECHAEVPFPVPPKAFGSYEALLASPEVDAVYIPLPTGLRQEWVQRAAAAGKHVVCEKPCAPTAAALREMIAACARHGRQFMDGVMFMHSRRLTAIRALLDDGQTIGTMKRLSSNFSFCAPPEFFQGNIRSSAELEPHGCLGDLGWYCLRFTLWARNWQRPQKVSGRILAEHNGVPTEFSGELIFEGGCSAGFYCSFLTENQEWMNLSGTRGYLHVEDFVLPFHGNSIGFAVQRNTFNVRGCQFEMVAERKTQSVAEHSNSHPESQEANLFRTFSLQCLSGSLNPAWPEQALLTQEVLEACLASARRQGEWTTFPLERAIGMAPENTKHTEREACG